MCAGLKCSSGARNEEEMEIFHGPISMFFMPIAIFINPWWRRKTNWDQPWNNRVEPPLERMCLFSLFFVEYLFILKLAMVVIQK